MKPKTYLVEDFLYQISLCFVCLFISRLELKQLPKKDYSEQILSYGQQIKTISSFVDAVRKTVGQYLGYNDTRGHINMIREILQNSFDEMEKKDSPCNSIWVEYDESTLMCRVRDNGRGIPFGNIESVFTRQHTSSNYIKKPGEYSSGRHGVGSKVTNACSKVFTVESYLYTGEARKVEFKDGHPWKKGEAKIPNTNKYQGTVISFIPSLVILLYTKSLVPISKNTLVGLYLYTLLSKSFKISVV